MTNNNLHKLLSLTGAKPSALPSVVAFAISVALGTMSPVAFAQSTDSNSTVALTQLQVRMVQGPDTDGDGLPNQVDLDDDNDGIPDAFEGGLDEDGNGFADAGSTDTDLDGTPDIYDLDSDNDGIPDVQEARSNRAAVIALDLLSNGAIDVSFPVGANGIADIVETSADSGVLIYTIPDTDNDGLLDFRDLDSDNDGIYDIVEAGGVDSDIDGQVDGFFDSDGKGIDDTVQASGLPLFDTDVDGVFDYRDNDSDNDTVPDRVEASGNPSQPTDTDADGAGDYRETDSDNDGVSDTIEAGPDPLNPVDTNGDGLPDYQDSTTQFDGQGGGPVGEVPGTDDTDGDGVINSQDPDDDNDGITDVIEGTGDNDSDGVPNYLDRDSDNDGVLDITETAIDSDGDTVPNYLDLDSDNDGIYDAPEAGRELVASNGRLSSSATVDSFGLAQGASGIRLDTDRDGVVDMLDLDSDNDSLLDVIEQGYPRAGANGRIVPFVDQNGDGADDSMGSRGSVLRDTDRDRIPDFRDLDSDQDSLSDLLELAGPSIDQDNSGTVDNFTDANSDGLDDIVAANPTPQTDTDNDGNPNSTDLDSDNDGVSDLMEAGGTDNNGDSRNDQLNDADLDGIPDSNDVDVTGGVDADGDGIDDAHDVDFVGGPDTDGDGVVDSQDPDSDGNGFAGPVNDGSGDGLSQGDPVILPDDNNDGIPDINQNPAGNSSGPIETGLAGSGLGCSIASVGSTTKTDPMLALLLGGSLMFLALRLKRRQIARAALVASTAALASCSTLGVNLDFGRSVSDPDFENRFYVGAGALMSQLEPNTDNDTASSVSESESSGASVTLGYDVSNRISVEGHYADLGEATLTPNGTVGYSVAGVSALYYGTNDERDRSRRIGLSAYGRLGLGTLQNEVTDVEYRRLNDAHLLAGVGVEYGLDNGFAVRGELIAHETDAKYAQLGVVYRFDGNNSRRPVLPAPPVETQPSVAVAELEPLPEPEPLPIDSDFDGVADLMDQCPTTPRGAPVKSDGCAVFNGVIEGINFEPNSDLLTADALAILQGVAQTLQEFPGIRVTIEAHTDNQGSATSNLLLSKRRAVSVARYLVDNGIAGSRLRPQAFGESTPRTSNATKEGRAANRRVEFSIL
ncbi:MAG: OmpA family protein [Granulosicoccus sp.]